MKRTFLALVLLLGLVPLADVRAEQGQGPADPNVRIEDLNLGTYWYGAPVDEKALLGKVVLVEIWGS